VFASVIAAIGSAVNTPVAASAAPVVAPVRADTLDGELMVAHGEYSKTGAMVLQTQLHTSTGDVRLTVPASQHDRIVALAGTRVRVHGAHRAGSFAVSDISQTSAALVANASVPAAGASVSARAPRSMRIAVVLLRLPGSSAQPATKAAVKASTFGATNSVAHWFSQTSGRQVAVTGTVFGYYTGVRSCDLATQLRTAASVAAKGGYVASKFDHLVVVTPEQGCGFGGLGWVGQNGVFLHGSASPGVMEHEIGHNLGLWHAGAYSCASASQGCLSEYGDPTDVMGTPYFNRGYNAEHKRRLGWLPSWEVRAVAKGTKTIALTASTNPLVAGSIQLIRLRATDGTVYAIDRRASVGYDTGLSGVWIRRVSATSTVSTALVRSTALGPGMTYNDPVHRVTIKTLTDSGPKAMVRVCVGPCQAGAK
jgi:hypothetical protein